MHVVDDDEVVDVSSGEEPPQPRAPGMSEKIRREMEEFEASLPPPPMPRTELPAEDEPETPFPVDPSGDRDVAVPEAEPVAPSRATAAPMTPSNVLRRRPRTQEVRRGAWSKLHGADVLLTLREPLRWSVDNGAVNWSVLEDQEQLAKRLKDMEVAQTDANLILVSRVARRMKKPQPWLGPLEAPLRNAILLMDNDDVITTGWEEWTKQPVSSQIRALPTRPRQLAVMLFGKDAHASPPAEEPEPQEAADAKWNRVPRELRLALRRVHVNLGHARLPDMLRCLRISRASEAAIRACKLFRCKECPRLLEPKIPRPSKLPVVDEFGIIVGLDVLEEKCADGVS